MQNIIILENMTVDELKEFFVNNGEKPFRALQYFQAIHKNRIFNPDEMTNFSNNLRVKLNQYNDIKNCSIIKRIDSKLDNTKKYLIEV